MNHRMETIFWLTKHSDFVRSHRVYIQLTKPEHAVCLHGWDKGVHKNHLGKILRLFILFLLWSKLNNTPRHLQRRHGTPALEEIKLENKSGI